jgi:hypothetical protein
MIGIATVMTATVLVFGYRAGRTRAAWDDVRKARRAVVVNRRQARTMSGQVTVGGLVIIALFALLAAVAYHAGR